MPHHYLLQINSSLYLFRRKSALIWEVKLLSRNALAYNEEDSLIVKQGEIVVQTLLKFIRLHIKIDAYNMCILLTAFYRSPLCTSVMECHPEAEEVDTDFETISPKVSLILKYFSGQEVLRRDMDNSSRSQRKRQVDSARVTRSMPKKYKTFSKLPDSYEEDSD